MRDLIDGNVAGVGANLLTAQPKAYTASTMAGLARAEDRYCR